MPSSVHAALLTLLCLVGCMDLRSSSLGKRIEPRTEPPPDAPVDLTPEAGQAPREREPQSADDDPWDAGDWPARADASMASDAGSAPASDAQSLSRDAATHDAARDAGPLVNPICRIEPWHCS